MIYTKEVIRKELLARRSSLPDHLVHTLSTRILEYLFESTMFYQANHIMSYLSYPKEVQTDNLVSKALNLQKQVSIPVCVKEERDLIPSRIQDLTIVEQGYFGLREPKKEWIDPVEVDQLNLIIVPGIAFNMQGNRIGHGMGYYDHFLRKIPKHIPKIALAYQFQIIRGNWNIDPWDIPVDGILTEEGWVVKNF
ncbi:5-formyltetrahydrofolate cyclo-ligase [Tepidibacillus fermentans]|uniref:5-formyltetrahydrofolate cyclo-ligase n=1 Tax=Tepidibacillus fermentans TaxID=1281767 RepID=A0A4R3KNG7_9BACI|nr:5-formyltetrahydrofolate cyclo-ligase [Tepidibacillus fermentans]TCS84568.1 5-formyltetrahydrofolate cyclo-ligase [Tepidibacillus fermentans]